MIGDAAIDTVAVLPPGFLVIDLAQYLQEPLYDPDSAAQHPDGNPIYQRVADIAAPARLAISGPATDGRRTALEYQRYGGRVYLDHAALRVVLQQERTGCPRR